jgi:parallel beta-helix repeat protein
MRRIMPCSTLVGGLAIAAAIVVAGPLDPPAGPVAPSYKTLSEVEPRIPINAQTCPGGSAYTYGVLSPGSYYLTGNLAGEPGKSVIRVGDNVTIDLNGFAIIGGAGSLVGIDGRVSDAEEVTIRNGVVRSCGGAGIEMDGESYGWVVENVHAVANGGAGIALARHSIVRNCRAIGNMGTGFQAQWGSLVESSTADANDVGFFAGNASTVTGCSAISNRTDGFTITGGSTATSCSARFNNRDGFAVSDGSTVSACSASRSVRDGIRLATGCSALDNTCSDNGPGDTELGAGIRSAGERNRIERNNVTGNYFGVAALSAGSFIAGNTARGNTTNFSITGSNTYGPIVSGPGQIATTSPWANFAY